MNTANPRWIALQVMLQVVERGRSLDDVFTSGWYQSLTASRRDLGLSRELVFGLCRWYYALSVLLATRLQNNYVSAIAISKSYFYWDYTNCW